jgi:hypothetical protein
MSFTMEVFGLPMELTCSSGTATGTVHAGGPAASPYINFMNLNSMVLTCDSLYPGTSASLTLPANGCATIGMSDATVREGTADTGASGNVAGSFNLPVGCVMTLRIGAACTTTIGGSTVAPKGHLNQPPVDTGHLAARPPGPPRSAGGGMARGGALTGFGLGTTS